MRLRCCDVFWRHSGQKHHHSEKRGFLERSTVFLEFSKYAIIVELFTEQCPPNFIGSTRINATIAYKTGNVRGLVAY